MASTLLVIGHETTPDTVLVQGGTLTEWALERGVRVRPAVAGAPAPAGLPELDGPESVDAIAVLGSAQGAWDDAVPWLGEEIAYLSEAVRREIPILGICFGGQILARVLGGTVAPGSRSENGWQTVRTAEPATIAPGPWMEFHFDVFTAPPGSRLLATSDLCDQAFRLGPHLGVQFHPEVTPASVETWIARWVGTDFEARLPALGVSNESLRADTARRAAASREASRTIWDSFATQAGLDGARLDAAGLDGAGRAPARTTTVASAPSVGPRERSA